MLSFSLTTDFSVFLKILNRKRITISIYSKWVPKWVQVSRNVDLTRKCCSRFVGSKWVQSDFVDFCRDKITIRKKFIFVRTMSRLEKKFSYTNDEKKI